MERKTFGGIPQKYSRLQESKIVLLPVPYDGTSTWKKGADKGPEAMLHAAENMELYDIETDSEVYLNGIFLEEPITEASSPEAVVKAVHQKTKELIKRGKFVTIMGGEHSISIGTVRAFNECFDDLSVLHIDAHADLRVSYMGSSCNHACAMYEASQTTNLVQVGIRSMDASEVSVMDEEKTFFAHEMAEDEYWIDKVVDLLGSNVFISFDLDALDPSIMPATGTPEPGGMLWYETLELLRTVFEQRNVVGFDLVELCPNPNHPSADFLAAKLYYKMLSYKYAGSSEEELDEEDETVGTSSNNFKFTEDEYEV
jgi:agmatinase